MFEELSLRFLKKIPIIKLKKIFKLTNKGKFTKFLKVSLYWTFSLLCLFRCWNSFVHLENSPPYNTWGGRALLLLQNTPIPLSKPPLSLPPGSEDLVQPYRPLVWSKRSSGSITYSWPQTPWYNGVHCLVPEAASSVICKDSSVCTHMVFGGGILAMVIVPRFLRFLLCLCLILQLKAILLLFKSA